MTISGSLILREHKRRRVAKTADDADDEKKTCEDNRDGDGSCGHADEPRVQDSWCFGRIVVFVPDRDFSKMVHGKRAGFSQAVYVGTRLPFWATDDRNRRISLVFDADRRREHDGKIDRVSRIPPNKQ